MRNLILRPGRYSLANEFDNMFNDFFGAFNRDNAGCCSVPAVDIRETDNDITMTFEMPGMDKKDIKVWVEDSVLTVSGERKVEKDEEKDNYIRSEIRSGSFSRSFKLPRTVDMDKLSADYNNGLLVVTLAKAEEAKPKEIEVKVK